MKKAGLFALTLALAFISAAQAAPDAENTKFRISLRSNPQRDCKLSLREISRFDGSTTGIRYLCAQLIGSNNELSLKEIADLVKTNDPIFEYAGNSEETLVGTLNAWRAALIKDAVAYTNVPARLSEIEPFSFAVVSRAEKAAVIAITNAATGEILTISVEMNATIATKNK